MNHASDDQAQGRSVPHYSEAHVLRGLEIVLRESLGEDVPLWAEERLTDTAKNSKALQEADFVDVLWCLGKFFGGGKDPTGWKQAAEEWLRPVENSEGTMTWGDLAKIIADSVPVVELRCASILGKLCAPAGAFRAIQQAVELHHGNVAVFGPSTAIRRRLRGGELRYTWQFLRWLTHDRLPPMRMTWTARVAWSMALVTVVSVLFAVRMRTDSWLLAVISALGVLILLAKQIDKIFTKPPPGFTTFRDLAMAMAQSPDMSAT